MGPRPTCPAGFFSVPTMEGKKPSRPRESVPVWIEAGMVFPPRSCSFFSSRWTRFIVLATSTHFHARPGLSYYCKSTRRLMRCRQQQSDESHPCSNFVTLLSHAPIPFHLNRSARPRYQTWTRSCWSFHDDLFDRAERWSLALGAPLGPTTLEHGQGQGGWQSMPLCCTMPSRHVA